MFVQRLVVGPLQVNCYLLVDQAAGVATVIDPGGDADTILAAAKQAGATITEIVLTHFHFDHILGLDALLAATQAKLSIHNLDAPLLIDPPQLFNIPGLTIPRGMTVDRRLQDGDEITVGEAKGTVLHVPGHSPGGAAFYFEEEKLLLSGDVLFRQGIGRSDLAGSDPQRLAQSLRRLLTLPEDTRVLPGHGEETTIGWERRHNPWLR